MVKLCSDLFSLGRAASLTRMHAQLCLKFNSKSKELSKRVIWISNFIDTRDEILNFLQT